jgi:CheY-like chemotaxis protein
MARILVIEDDNSSRWIVVRTLVQMGHTVLEASNGVEGLRANRDAPVDLVLTDLVMPEKEGIETIMELRRTHPMVKIIAMTGGLNPVMARTNLQNARFLGASKVLLKPFDQAELAAALDEVLGMARQVEPPEKSHTPS